MCGGARPCSAYITSPNETVSSAAAAVRDVANVFAQCASSCGERFTPSVTPFTPPVYVSSPGSPFRLPDSHLTWREITQEQAVSWSARKRCGTNSRHGSQDGTVTNVSSDDTQPFCLLPFVTQS